jgi:hypothetical protein
MQLEVLDHIIIGDNKYFSFADEGLISAYANSLRIKRVNIRRRTVTIEEPGARIQNEKGASQP